MTLKQIEEQVMFQTNNDADDLGEFKPHVVDYINEGYDLLLEAFYNMHIDSESEDYAPLSGDSDEPNLPEYAHRALADYGTYMVYRNGNAVKQQRGNPYLSAFYQIQAKLKFEGTDMSVSGGGSGSGSANGRRYQFRNLYTS